MVQTLSRRGKFRINNPSLVIIDEAHLNYFDGVLNEFTDVPIIGATATPTGKAMKYYQGLVNPVDIEALIDSGHLAKARYYAMMDDVQCSLTLSGGEFTESSQHVLFSKRKMYKGAADVYCSQFANKKALVFCPGVNTVEQVYGEFIAAGANAAMVTADTPKPLRNVTIDAFKHGKISVLVNCGILTTGFDDPSIDAIFLLRATTSLPLYLQMCGRGSRPAPGKSEFAVLDFGENFKYHGLWCTPRKWDLRAPKGSNGAPLKPAPQKHCPKCRLLIVKERY